MHEMATARRPAAEALGRMKDDGSDRVGDVGVVLGSARLSADSVRGHFELAARGTPAEGAALHITREPSRNWYFDCTLEFSSRARGGWTCPRGGGSVSASTARSWPTSARLPRRCADMCLSRPGRVVRHDGTMVEVQTGDQVRWHSALARPEVRTGDWVLTHANLVLTILTPDEAAEMADAVAELIGGRADEA
jgi:Zn finger protein HypA/HybF involved in hydrogenase expression/hydrogenase maturation factor